VDGHARAGLLEQIEEAAEDAFANFERRRNAMLRALERSRSISSIAADDPGQTTPEPPLSLDGPIESDIDAAAQALANLESVFRVSFLVGDFDGAASAMDSANVETFTAFAEKLIRLAAAGDPRWKQAQKPRVRPTQADQIHRTLKP
jgi:hypothetical protein